MNSYSSHLPESIVLRQRPLNPRVGRVVHSRHWKSAITVYLWASDSANTWHTSDPFEVSMDQSSNISSNRPDAPSWYISSYWSPRLLDYLCTDRQKDVFYLSLIEKIKISYIFSTELACFVVDPQLQRVSWTAGVGEEQQGIIADASQRCSTAEVRLQTAEQRLQIIK